MKQNPKIIKTLIGTTAIFSIYFFFSGLFQGFNDIQTVLALSPIVMIGIIIAQEIIFRKIILDKLGIQVQAFLYGASMSFLYSWGVESYLIYFIFLTISGLILGMIKKIYGLKAVFLFQFLYVLSIVCLEMWNYTASIVLLFGLGLIPFFWHMQIEKHDFRKTLLKLGLTTKGFLANILLGIIFFFLLIFVTGATISILNDIGIKDVGLVAEIVKKAPLIILVLSFTLGPVIEEIFFRGFLQKLIEKRTKRVFFSILTSSIIFSLFHAAYNSIAELAGAFVAGMILGYLYTKSKSLVAPIVCHAIYNAVAAIIITNVAQVI